jgi:hypothetical protein
MKRIGAHYLYINPDKLIKNGVVEINDEGIVTDYFSLDNTTVESAHTEFYTGLLSPALPFDNNVQFIVSHLWELQQKFPNSTVIDFIKLTDVMIPKDAPVCIWLFEKLDLIHLKVTPETTIRAISGRL